MCLWNRQVRREVQLMRSKHGKVPGLAVIMVGERRDSAKYVSMKQVRNKKYSVLLQRMSIEPSVAPIDRDYRTPSRVSSKL